MAMMSVGNVLEKFKILVLREHGVDTLPSLAVISATRSATGEWREGGEGGGGGHSHRVQ